MVACHLSNNRNKVTVRERAVGSPPLFLFRAKKASLSSGSNKNILHIRHTCNDRCQMCEAAASLLQRTAPSNPFLLEKEKPYWKRNLPFSDF